MQAPCQYVIGRQENAEKHANWCESSVKASLRLSVGYPRGNSGYARQTTAVAERPIKETVVYWPRRDVESI
jgi:hypothetical protein